MLGPCLSSHRVSLRPIEAHDLVVFSSWYSDPNITRFLMSRSPFVRTPAMWTEWLEDVARSPQSVVWSIVLADVLIGLAGLQKYDHDSRSATFGLVIGDADCWRQGIATEVGRTVLDYAFHTRGLRRIEVELMAGHSASRRLVEALGFQAIGVRRRCVWHEGQWEDVLLADLLAEEHTGTTDH